MERELRIAADDLEELLEDVGRMLRLRVTIEHVENQGEGIDPDALRRLNILRSIVAEEIVSHLWRQGLCDPWAVQPDRSLL